MILQSNALIFQTDIIWVLKQYRRIKRNHNDSNSISQLVVSRRCFQFIVALLSFIRQDLYNCFSFSFSNKGVKRAEIAGSFSDVRSVLTKENGIVGSKRQDQICQIRQWWWIKQITFIALLNMSKIFHLGYLVTYH